MRIKKVTSNVGEKIAGAALWMIGTGVLLTIWGGVWVAYLVGQGVENDIFAFVSAGVLLSGLSLGLIGFFAGRIGRVAREGADDEADAPGKKVVAE